MQRISKQDLKHMNHEEKKDFVLINVLDQQAFNKQHIRTSINIPYKNEDFAELVERVVGNKKRSVIVYCANFDCNASPNAAKALEKAGFENVFDYEGGTEDWYKEKEAA